MKFEHTSKEMDPNADKQTAKMTSKGQLNLKLLKGRLELQSYVSTY